MSLKSKYTTSNGSRKRRVFALTWRARPLRMTLSYRKISNGGRSSNTGKIVIYSKGSIKKRIKFFNICYTTRTANPLLLSSITFLPTVNKLVNLLITDAGSYFYFPSTHTTHMFTLTSAYGAYTDSFTRGFRNFFSLIFKLKTFKKISNLELIPNKGIQYARSAGSFAKMLNLNVARHVALIKLPSGVRKYFSIYSVALADSCTLSEKKKIEPSSKWLFSFYRSKSSSSWRS